jgi:hypothetical protein
MADNKRALIEYKVVKPWVDASALGTGCAAFAIVANGPAWSWACLGAGFSLVWYWGRNNLYSVRDGKPSPRRGRHVTVNSHNKKRDVAIFDYQPGYITRDSWPDIILGWFRHPRPMSSSKTTGKPSVLEEFVFISQYLGQPIELQEKNVKRFLAAAWYNRDRGSGLGERRWVREWKRRPAWYQELGPPFYYAMLSLIGGAQKQLNRQLVIKLGHQQYGLKFDHHTMYGLLKWVELQKCYL